MYMRRFFQKICKKELLLLPSILVLIGSVFVLFYYVCLDSNTQKVLEEKQSNILEVVSFEQQDGKFDIEFINGENLEKEGVGVIRVIKEKLPYSVSYIKSENILVLGESTFLQAVFTDIPFVIPYMILGLSSVVLYFIVLLVGKYVKV